MSIAQAVTMAATPPPSPFPTFPPPPPSPPRPFPQPCCTSYPGLNSVSKRHIIAGHALTMHWLYFWPGIYGIDMNSISRRLYPQQAQRRLFCIFSHSLSLTLNIKPYVLYLQLFAASGLETADFGNMESLSNHMGLFLQVCVPFIEPHSSWHCSIARC